MTEARRFLRYLFPGMIFIVLLSIYLFISAGQHFTGAVGNAMKGAKEGGGIFQAGVFVLFVSGAGYLFATLYHLVGKHQSLRLPNPAGLLRDAVGRNWLTVVDRRQRTDVALGSGFCPSQAWSILGAYYHARIHDPRFSAAHDRIVSLNDIVHGLGASVVASIFAFVAWMPLHGWFAPDLCARWYSYAIPIIASTALAVNYWLTGREAEQLIDGVTSKFLADEAKTGAITLYFPRPGRRD